MPKKAFELRQFLQGSQLSPSSTDIQPEAAINSLNIDPVTEMGKLKGVPEDIRVTTKDAYPTVNIRLNAAIAAGDTIIVTINGTSFSTPYDTSNDKTWENLYETLIDESITWSSLSGSNWTDSTWTINSTYASLLSSISPGNMENSDTDGTTAFSSLRGIILVGKPNEEFTVSVSTTTVAGYWGTSTNAVDYDPEAVLVDEFTLDTTPYLYVNATEFEYITSKGKDSLVFYCQEDQGKIKYIEDFYGGRGLVAGYDQEVSDGGTGGDVTNSIVPWSVPSAPSDISMEGSRSTVYIGAGGSNASKALWFGQPKEQFATDQEGYRLEEAQAYPVDREGKAARFMKTIRLRATNGGAYTDFIYGFSLDSQYIYTVVYDAASSTSGASAKGDRLPCDPSCIAESTRAESFWVGSRSDMNIYRCTVDTGTGTMSSIEQYILTEENSRSHNGATGVDEQRATGSVITDILESNDGTIGWVLFSQEGGGFSYNERWLYSFDIPANPSTSNAVTLDCRTPATKKCVKSSEGNFYEDRSIYKWRNRSRYLANCGLHERKLWRFEYNAACNSDNSNAGQIDYIAEENILNGDNTAFDPDYAGDWSKIEPGHTTYWDGSGSDSWSMIYAGAFPGWADDPNLEIRPFRFGLIDLGKSGSQYRVGVVCHIKGKLLNSSGYLNYYHYDTGSLDLAEKYKYEVTGSPSFTTLDQVCVLTSSTDHTGLACYDGYNTAQTSRSTHGDSLGSNSNYAVCCFNESKFVMLKKFATSNTFNSSNEQVDQLIGTGSIVDHSRLYSPIITGGHFTMSTVGTDTTRSHFRFYDSANLLDNSGGINQTIGLHSSAFTQPLTFKSSRPTTSAVNFHESYTTNAMEYFCSTTAGVYENGRIGFNTLNGAMVNNSVYATHGNGTSTYGMTFALGSDGDNFLTGTTYFYKMSLLYDGFQESPLNQFSFQLTITGDSKETLIGTLFVKKPDKRATDMLIYRKNGPDEFYRLVKEIKLDGAWQYDEAADLYSSTFVDSGNLGATYESITGMSEVLRDTGVNYALSTSGNNCLIVANCNHPELTNGDHMLLKSKPGTWSIFDWTEDIVTLPNVPTAIKYFAGRIFAWDRANMHKIGFQSMSIEDSYEGIGCYGENSVIVTDLGMFFADRNNIYKHDGTICTPIGTPILKSSLGIEESYPWHSINHYKDPKLLYDADKQSIFVCFDHLASDGTHVYRAWCYNIARNRWDLIEIPNPKAVQLGVYGEAFLSDGIHLFDLQSSDYSKKTWSYWSRSQDLGVRGVAKKVFNVKVVHDPAIGSDAFSGATANFELNQDGTNLNAGGNLTKTTLSSNSLANISQFNLDTDKRDTYAMSVRFNEQQGEVDAVTFIWKPKTIK
jgi:hypothetical protein